MESGKISVRYEEEFILNSRGKKLFTRRWMPAHSEPKGSVFLFHGYGMECSISMEGMPTNPYIYANDLIDVLKKKHASGTYKSLVFYLEACESGSIFEGLLPEGLNIYATTASNAEESSWGTYCPGGHPGPPLEYHTCLGDADLLHFWHKIDLRDKPALEKFFASENSDLYDI